MKKYTNPIRKFKIIDYDEYLKQSMFIERNMILYISNNKTYGPYNGLVYFHNDNEDRGVWMKPEDILWSKFINDDVKDCVLFEVLHLL